MPTQVLEALNAEPGEFIGFKINNEKVTVHKIIPKIVNNGRGGNGNKHSSPSTPKQIGEKQKCVEQ